MTKTTTPLSKQDILSILDWKARHSWLEHAISDPTIYFYTLIRHRLPYSNPHRTIELTATYTLGGLRDYDGIRVGVNLGPYQATRYHLNPKYQAKSNPYYSVSAILTMPKLKSYLTEGAGQARDRLKDYYHTTTTITVVSIYRIKLTETILPG